MACGGIFDVDCNARRGGLSPANILRQTQQAGRDIASTADKAGQDVGNALNELQASILSGPTLERAIIESHNTAVNGAMPIPPGIRQQLTGYASEDSMNRVRFKVGDNGIANLARLLEQGGAASAVTLIDVIVFRGPGEAGDLALWAHELHHVDQYQEWGVHSFAVQYARNARGVEGPAYAKGNGYWSWTQQMQAQQQVGFPRTPFGVSGDMPSDLGAFCDTPFGRFGPGAAQPVGAPCLVQMPGGIVAGSIGQ